MTVFLLLRDIYLVTLACKDTVVYILYVLEFLSCYFSLVVLFMCFFSTNFLFLKEYFVFQVLLQLFDLNLVPYNTFHLFMLPLLPDPCHHVISMHSLFLILKKCWLPYIQCCFLYCLHRNHCP